MKQNTNTASRIREQVEKRNAIKAEMENDKKAEARYQAERADAHMRDLRDQFQKADNKIEALKDKVDGMRNRNSTVRVGSIAAIGAGALATTMVALQSGGEFDNMLRYGVSLAACFGAFILNKHFHERDVKLSEVLRRTNKWAKGEFLPEEVQTFKELYDEVTSDYKLDNRKGYSHSF